MTQNTDFKAQKVLTPDYKRLRFKKLIPQLLNEDFQIPVRHWVINKVLNININQEKNYFNFSIRKSEDLFILSYKHTQDRFALYSYSKEEFKFQTVSELYSFVKEKLKKDGLLTREELMVRDIIV